VNEPPVRHGVVAVILRDQRFLMIERSQQVAAPGMMCFPGGGIQSGASEAVALERELREELDVKVHPIRPLWRSLTPWNVALSWWLADLPEDQLIQPNPAEVADVEWVTPAEMDALPNLLESNRHFLQALRAGVFALD